MCPHFFLSPFVQYLWYTEATANTTGSCVNIQYRVKRSQINKVLEILVVSWCNYWHVFPQLKPQTAQQLRQPHIGRKTSKIHIQQWKSTEKSKSSIRSFTESWRSWKRARTLSELTPQSEFWSASCLSVRLSPPRKQNHKIHETIAAINNIHIRKK